MLMIKIINIFAKVRKLVIELVMMMVIKFTIKIVVLK